jgi:hypothetical protein
VLPVTQKNSGQRCSRASLAAVFWLLRHCFDCGKQLQVVQQSADPAEAADSLKDVFRYVNHLRKLALMLKSEIISLIEQKAFHIAYLGHYKALKRNM